MQAKISHSGIVETVSEGCVACKVSGYCHAAEAKEKIVDVFGCDTAKYSTGQKVIVTASTTVARKALVLGFVMPFLLVIGVLVVVLFLTDNEGVAALAALGSLLPYYFLIWLRRDSIQRDISFMLEEKNT